MSGSYALVAGFLHFFDRLEIRYSVPVGSPIGGYSVPCQRVFLGVRLALAQVVAKASSRSARLYWETGALCLGLVR